jgi:carboxyl-terminal processing protease
VLQQENDFTKVVRLVPAGPADKGGQLKPEDRIVGVGQGPDSPMVDVIGWRLDDVVGLIRGPKGTLVRLEVIPADAVDDSQRVSIRITRNEVRLEDQAATKRVLKIDRGGETFSVGVIDVPTFYIDFAAYRSGKADYRSTTRDVERLLGELKAEGVDGVVIDLRDNGGGALQEAAALTGLFIKSGPTAQVRGPWGRISAVPDDDPHTAYDGPLIVLVNRMSASASEIFAGAIQDYHRGIVVGARTFGKGTVQALANLSQGQLKYTMAKFYRVSGKGMQQLGVDPDIRFPAVYDADKVGESAMPDAMPWDQIAALSYAAFPDNSGIVHRLASFHEERARTSPDFHYLIERLEEQKSNQRKTEISLRESVRRQERSDLETRRLGMENQRREAKGEPPFASADALKKLDEEKAAKALAGKPSDEPDPLLDESAQLLTDFISMSRRALAKTP